MALILALALPALAGHAKCTKSADACAEAMKEKYQTRGWSGIDKKEYNEDHTITIRSILPDSPADKAGLKADDVIVSMNGLTLSKENEAKIKEMKAGGFKIGDSVSFGIKRSTGISTMTLTLEKIPEAVLTARIERHAQEQHQVARN